MRSFLKLTACLSFALMLAAALPAPAAESTAADSEKIDTESTCTALAYCDETGEYISCTGTNVCIAEDQDCDNGQRGYVECDSYWEDQCDACPIDCSGYPYMTKCIDGLVCKPGCHNCGNGTCWHGTCNCLI